MLLWWAAGPLPGWAQQPTYVWAVSAGGTGYDSGNCVATDQAGNVYQAGLFSGTARFGSLALTAQANKLDIFLAKYSPQGQVQWVRQIGGNNLKFVASLAVDNAGEAVITGSYTSTDLPATSLPALTLGNVTLTGSSISAAMYVARYDAQGQLLWATHSLGQGRTGTYCEGTDVALAADGSTYLTGHYGGSGNVGFNQVTAAAAPYGTIFLAKYDRSGRLLWLRDKLGSGKGVLYERTPQLAVSPTQQVYLIGLFNQTVSLGSLTLTSASSLAAYYYAQLDAQGVFLAGRADVLDPQEACYDLASSPTGNLVCTCTYQGTVQHGAQQFTAQNGPNPLVLSFSALGDFQWGQTTSSALQQGDQQVRSAVVDGQGNVYTCFASQDFLLVSYSATGSARWSFASPAPVTSLAVSAPDQVVLTGLYEGKATFAATTLICQGDLDAFLAKWAPPGVAEPTPPPGSLPALEVPNIITPNHDGHNDYFQVRGLPAGPWELRVYSRWGRLVYATTDYQQNWDAPGLADGSYFYWLAHATQATIKGWLQVQH